MTPNVNKQDRVGPLPEIADTRKVTNTTTQITITPHPGITISPQTSLRSASGMNANFASVPPRQTSLPEGTTTINSKEFELLNGK